MARHNILTGYMYLCIIFQIGEEDIETAIFILYLLLEEIDVNIGELYDSIQRWAHDPKRCALIKAELKVVKRRRSNVLLTLNMLGKRIL